MTLSELGIKRHVMAFMFSFGIMLFGLVSYFLIGIDQYPDIDFPFISVVITQDGAEAEVVDSTITKVLLEKLNGISGIDYIRGSSSPGLSRINISFELEKDVDVAFNEVQAKIDEAKNDLPSDIDSPIVLKATTSGGSIVEFTLTGNRTIQQLNAYADNIIKKPFETISGVSEVELAGSRDRELRVYLDTYKAAKLGLAIKDVINILNSNHVQLPGGYLVGDKKELLMKLDLEYHDPIEMEKMVIKSKSGSIVRLSEIAEVYDDLEDFRQYSSFNSSPSITLSLSKIVGGSAFYIENEAIKRLNEDVLPALEPGTELKVTYNSVTFIRAVVHSLEEHLYLGTLLTALVVYIFLRSFMSTIIVSLAIPISLLGSVIVMYAFGYTFNTITLLGLLLLIGVVVDDAIIVLENIYKKLESGMKPVEAAIAGSNQVVFAVLAATLSLVSIFGPVMFMGGIIGKFFQSFAVVVVFGVLISYIVAMYVTPMLCSRYLTFKGHGSNNFFNRFLNYCFTKLDNAYLALLRFALEYKLVVILSAIMFFMSSFLFFAEVPGEFTAEADKSRFRIIVKLPQGSNIYYTLDKVHQVEDILSKYKEIKDFSVKIGSGRTPAVSRAQIDVNMVPINERDIRQYKFMDIVQGALDKNIIGAKVLVTAASTGGGEYELSFNLVGPNLHQVYDYSVQLAQKMKKNDKLGESELGTELLPQLKFTPNRDKMSLIGVTADDIVKSIAVSVGGLKIGKYNGDTDLERYDMTLKGFENQFTWKDSLNNIFLKAGDKIFRLDNVVDYEEYLGFASVERFGTMYSSSINMNPIAPLGQSMAEVQKIAAELLPAGYKVEFIGASKEFVKTIKNVIVVFTLALVLLYMVLASQFNSFIQPLILMVSVPLAVVGGVFSLYITGYSLNIFSMIGLILLIGLVSKNAILLIDFTNELRKNGKSINEALLEACPSRLRPILMTSLTVILSMVPAAISKAEGSEDNASLSVVVIGGMISSTLLTLVIIPTIYSIVESIFEKRKKTLNLP